MNTETRPYNSFDYCETVQEINERLGDAFADEDPRLALVALEYFAKKAGMSRLAQEVGVNRESLYKSLSPDGNPSFLTIMRVMRALGLRVLPVCDRPPFPLAKPAGSADAAQGDEEREPAEAVH